MKTLTESERLERNAKERERRKNLSPEKRKKLAEKKAEYMKKYLKTSEGVATKKTRNESTITQNFRLHKEYDSDVIEKLTKVNNKKAYFCELVRADEVLFKKIKKNQNNT